MTATTSTETEGEAMSTKPHINEVADKFAPCYPADRGDLADIAAHYTVQAYAAHQLAYLGPLWMSLQRASYPEGDRLEWWRTAILNAGNAFAAAAALNCLLWNNALADATNQEGEPMTGVADAIHAAHRGEDEECADLLDTWLERHGINTAALDKACAEATR